MVHEFVQVHPQQAALLASHPEGFTYDMVLRPQKDMRIYRLPDELVLRNLGMINDQPRYFSSIHHCTDGTESQGINYWGVTLLDARALAELTAPIAQCGAIHPRDKYALGLFRRFGEETVKAGLWLVHFGI